VLEVIAFCREKLGTKCAGLDADEEGGTDGGASDMAQQYDHLCENVGMNTLAIL
jgi:hypothetical protein